MYPTPGSIQFNILLYFLSFFKLQNIVIVGFEAPLNLLPIQDPILFPHMIIMTLNLVSFILKDVLICLLKMFEFRDNMEDSRSTCVKCTHLFLSPPDTQVKML